MVASLVKCGPKEIQLVKALFNYYHPGGWRSGGMGQSLHSVWALCDDSGAFMAAAILTTPMEAVVRKLRSVDPGLKDLKPSEALFIMRIMTIPPYKVGAVELLNGLCEQLAGTGVRCLFSFSYPTFPGHLYQLAKFRKAYERHGYTCYYRVLTPGST